MVFLLPQMRGGVRPGSVLSFRTRPVCRIPWVRSAECELSVQLCTDEHRDLQNKGRLEGCSIHPFTCHLLSTYCVLWGKKT